MRPTRRTARICVLVPLLVLLLTAAPLALGWAALGHRLVGELAQRQLNPQAQAEVRALLAGEPEPTLAGVATWADELRNADPARFKATSKWHYINARGGGCDFDLARDCPGGDCVVAAIERQRAILADRSQPRAARRDALKFLVHLVGDIHQPLHAGDRPDAGGNGYQISLRTDLEPESYARNRYANGVMGTNLHAVWDYYILGERRLTADEYADALDASPAPAAPDAAAGAAPPLAWAGESCRLIRTHRIYPDTHKLDRSYLERWRPLAERRVRQAAHRLAMLLNQTLGNGPAPP